MSNSPAPIASKAIQPGQVWSLSDMLQINAKVLLTVIQKLERIRALIDAHSDIEGGVFNPNIVADEDIKSGAIKSFTELRDALVALGANYSIKSVDRLITNINDTSFVMKFGFLQHSAQVIATRITDELEERNLFCMEEKYSGYYSQSALFGAEVFSAFPSANDDIVEAGNCLALDRATGCVMHLMRVMEAGLLALAKSVGVTDKNDWGTYLRFIETELDSRAKAAGARSGDEQFYSETAANFDRVRRAFRNPTMHVGANYSPKQAEDILLAVRSFMEHLPPRIHE